MTEKSCNSNVFATIGLPEVFNLRSSFIYNYYVSEESATEDSTPYRGSAEGTPRSVELEFQSPDLKDVTIGNGNDYREFVNNLDKVHSVEDIPNMGNTYITVQDTGLLARASDAINRSCRIRGIKQTNPTDKALSLSYVITGSIDPNILQSLSVNYESANLTFYSQGKVEKSEKYSLATGLPATCLVYDKIVSDICKNAELQNVNKSPVALGLMSKNLEKRQVDERANSPSISSDDFTSILAPISYYEGESNSSISPTIVGYMIERVEELSSGERNKNLIGTLPPGVTNRKFVDYNIKYGSRYSYTVRAVYTMKVPEILMNRFDSITSKILVASAPSNITSVTTEEKIPPKPPSDIRFSYDSMKSLLSIQWSAPVDMTRDVTRYQLFRRTSLNEPFTLLKEFDFDKSQVKISRNEVPIAFNIQKSDYPVRRAIDYDFGKSSNYVYALCSVDAHGYVSNYSSQYLVTFNRRLNSITVKCISQAGAPRPYPNIYVVSESLTLDTITRNGVSSANISFDPEYLKVVDRKDNDLGLIKYDNSSTYFMSLIDTTRAEQIIVPIAIKDLRSITT